MKVDPSWRLGAKGILVSSLVAASLQAMAGCSPGLPRAGVPMSWSPAEADPGLAAYRQDADAFMKVAAVDVAARPSMVGTWRFDLISDGTAYPGPIPLGGIVDFGTQQWSSDHNEIMISAGRAGRAGPGG